MGVLVAVAVLVAVGELVWLWWFGIWVLRFVQPQRHDQHLGGGQHFVLGPGSELGTGFCQWLNGLIDTSPRSGLGISDKLVLRPIIQ